jgi:hypothetical protein
LLVPKYIGKYHKMITEEKKPDMTNESWTNKRETTLADRIRFIIVQP